MTTRQSSMPHFGTVTGWVVSVKRECDRESVHSQPELWPYLARIGGDEHGNLKLLWAPVIEEHEDDLLNFSDDDYDLRVPVRVCSKCGAAVSGKEARYPRESD